jgi:DNA-binding response OmpR family regulator
VNVKKLGEICAFSVTICATTADFEAMTTLLFIEDDESIRTALRLALEDDGFDVVEAVDGESGIAKFGKVQPDLVLLDLRLPDISGFEVCRALRRSSITPIIMVTAQTDTADLVNGFDAGADDYVTKPVVPRELLARIKAALRRSQQQPDRGPDAHSIISIGEISINRDLSVVSRAGEELALTKTEYLLLCEFADHPGMVLSRDQLLERVWGYEYLGDSRLVDAHVRRLRVKIERQPDEPTLIVTVRGMGYRLINQ